MNNNSNRNNNNRRRGRGNRNQGGGGGHQQNRIDSRARGNAPQLLDKYKKLAQDAAHNGDRVQAEYYLQFADHYFRVIADNKARQDETRGRRDERDYDDEDAGEFGSDDTTDQSGDDRRRSGNQANNGQRRQRGRRDDFEVMDRGAEGEEFSADDNPFVPDDMSGTDDRAPRGERNAERGGDRTEKRDDDRGQERSERRPRRRNPRDEAPARAEESASFDAAVLPPSISAGDEEAPKPRLKPRRRRPAGEAEEAVETVES